MAPKGARRYRWLLVGAGGLAVAGVVWYAVALYPWLAGPDESAETIGARWERVVGRAEPEPALRGDDSRLREAAVAAKRVRVEPEEAAGGVPWTDADRLPGEAGQALGALVAWARQGAAMGEEACPDQQAANSLDLLALGKLALASGKSDEVGAALVVASGMRRAGNVLDLAVGSHLAVYAIRTAGARGLPIGPDFDLHAPRFDEFLPAAIRDVACVIAMIDPEGDAEFGRSRHKPLLAPVRPRRERLVAEQYFGRLFEGAWPRRGDLASLVAAFESRAEIPASVLVQLIADEGYEQRMSYVARTFSEAIEEYRELLVPARAGELAYRLSPCAELSPVGTICDSECQERGLVCAPLCRGGPAPVWREPEDQSLCEAGEDPIFTGRCDETLVGGGFVRCCCGPEPGRGR